MQSLESFSLGMLAVGERILGRLKQSANLGTFESILFYACQTEFSLIIGRSCRR